MNTAVLLATYNSGEYLAPMLDSLMSQTFTDFTVYVHDDGSTDGTVEVIRQYKKRYPGRFKRVKDKRRRGARDSFFYLLKKVEADIYFFADDDDVWFPDKISAMKKRLPDDVPACVFSDMIVTDENLQPISGSFIATIGRSGRRTRYQQILIDNPAAGCCMCINRQLRDLAIARHVNKKRLPMHDKWILVLASIFGRTVFMDEPFLYYRQHGDNEMGAGSESTFERIKRNLKDVVSGDFLHNKKRFLSESKLIAWELLKYPDLPDDVRRVLQQYVMISGKDKISRIIFYKKHGFNRKNGTLWMYLWV